MKTVAKELLPVWLLQILISFYAFFRRKKSVYHFKKTYKKDMLRYLKHSRTLDSNNPDKMIGAIVLQYHVIEKGLTMPETRPGFGRERIKSLCISCIDFILKYGSSDEQIKHAIGVILEYKDYHDNSGFQLDNELLALISRLKNLSEEPVKCSKQIQTTKDEYFRHTSSTFCDFSNSRSSVRNYGLETLDIQKILKSIELSRNTPSACNRQSWRTYIYTDTKKVGQILEIQGGNRGFGHLANKLVVIAGELGGFCYTNERNQVYVDGGMYAMNLLYALHSNKVAACILNCSFDFDKEMEVKKICEIKNSEVLIAMISCGEAPSEFKIAVSPRYSIGKTNKTIETLSLK
ncbi:MAG: nitroreductase family protein [Bacteroidales bacterium]